MQALDTLQRQLEGLYELSVAHQVSDFLTSRPPPGEAPAPREQLLLIEDEEGLQMGLYLAPALLEELAQDDPLRRLSARNLNSFCQALEGVSHFLYVAWRAGYDRAVSRLEMELQAEVDKYVTASLLLSRQRGGRVSRRLRHLLFDRVCYDTSLAPAAQRRYRDANDYASRLCRALELRYARHLPDHPEVLKELRRFYRLGERHKLAWIDAIA